MKTVRNPDYFDTEFKRDSYHCRYCGTAGLWVEVGVGDYYVGPQYWCRTCDRTFTMG